MYVPLRSGYALSLDTIAAVVTWMGSIVKLRKCVSSSCCLYRCPFDCGMHISQMVNIYFNFEQQP